MHIFEAVPKQWGNSVGITIPKEIIREEHIFPKKKIKVLILTDQMKKLKQAFGALKLKKPTQQAMEEIDEEGYD